MQIDYPDSRQAMSEGWGIFWSDSRGWEIQRDDERATFPTDDDARDHVRRRASEGFEYHRHVLRFLGELE